MSMFMPIVRNADNYHYYGLRHVINDLSLSRVLEPWRVGYSVSSVHRRLDH